MLLTARSIGMSWGGKPLLGSLFVHERGDLIRVNAHHDVLNMIVDFCEPMPSPGWDHDDVASLEVERLAVLNFLTIIARPVEQAHGFRICRTTLHVGDLWTQHQRT